ncbi:3-HYDROXYACYL-COA DEHYDRATASE 1 [Ceraceosorus bombacis]|uniref:3-HYDROXYACYL-COA DEHYDRATASE 1 n=1 Tax=Ceraceosorus bombacis TaxID=401625 RepID=A0A0N7LAB6_9BASI|nr:3-HYDROXYACYL-COA DEHYDRATASE 1 [Ceraceosorus bombacis]
MPDAVNFPSSGKALVSIETISQTPRIWVLHMLAAETPDNRLTRNFLTALASALDHVQSQWESIAGEEAASKGAALISTGVLDEKNKSSRFFSNGLDFEAAIADEHFFDQCLMPVYERLLSFPIPTIASVGGHAFAAGFGLISAHDYRVMSGIKGYACMNEIDFGAQLPPGLHAVLRAKFHSPAVMRKMVLEGHRFTGQELKALEFVDELVPPPGGSGGPQQTLEGAVQLAHKVAPKATKDAYGSNKLVMYQPFLHILRQPNSDITGALTDGSKL